MMHRSVCVCVCMFVCFFAFQAALVSHVSPWFDAGARIVLRSSFTSSAVLKETPSFSGRFLRRERPPPPPRVRFILFDVSQACRYGGQRDKVMDVLEMMVEDGVPPSGKSYSSALQVKCHVLRGKVPPSLLFS